MKKLALCVGINAYPPGLELAGCVNDALDWSQGLAAKGYDVATIFDTAATGDAIVTALLNMVNAARFGDRIVFTFSGHGTYVRDTSGDEPDRRDEAICPVDVTTLGSLLDDDLQNILASRRVGVRATMVADSCYSGSVTRFADLEAPPGKPRFLDPEALPPPARAFPDRVRRAPAQPVMLLSGCKDTEVSYDARIDGRPCGAFSHPATGGLGATEDPKWTQVFGAARAVLPSDRWPQTPQLTATAWQRRWKVA